MPPEDRDLLHRGKRVVDLDVKAQPHALLGLVAKADVLLDCFRPGTCERLGIGPDECAAVQFFGQLLSGLGLTADDVPGQLDIGGYGRMREVFTERFARKTRDEWTEIFAGTDACVTPVLTWSEAASHPHMTARATVINANGVEQAAPAPRLSRTAAGAVGPPLAATTPLDEIGW